eukprot:m.278813 g.278813  ORF g.278813 m.278813 type:complete len:186 (+) comp54893_c2_seq4:1-558(+)
MKKWTLEYLSGLSGLDEGIRACRDDSRTCFYPEEVLNGSLANAPTFKSFLAQTIERQEAGDARACFSVTGTLGQKSLLKDVELPAGIHTNEKELSHNIWLSHGQVETGLHYDQWYNSVAVIGGRKRFVLFGPEHSNSLYPALHCHNCSQKQRRKTLEQFVLSQSHQYSQFADQYAKYQQPTREDL